MSNSVVLTKSPAFTSIATAILVLLMFVVGGLFLPGFFAVQVVFNLLIDNAYLLVLSIGMTFVILSGGIDLSIGSVLALTTLLCGFLLQTWHWSAWIVIPLVLLFGFVFGATMGAVIQYFKLQPFIVTLAGMFLARGLCYLISINSITIEDGFFTRMSQTQIALFNGFISPSVLVALALLALAIFFAHYTAFGRAIYAIGGNEQSALMMGLPVARAKVLVYGFSGCCAALAGVLFSFYMLSGYALHAEGSELDAIAAVVIGGTVLNGGVGYVAGTVSGVMMLGLIQTMIAFDGTLSSWWIKIVIGALLLVFCLVQRMLSAKNHSLN